MRGQYYPATSLLLQFSCSKKCVDLQKWSGGVLKLSRSGLECLSRIFFLALHLGLRMEDEKTPRFTVRRRQRTSSRSRSPGRPTAFRRINPIYRRLTAQSVYRFRQFVSGGNVANTNLNGSTGAVTQIGQQNSSGLGGAFAFTLNDLSQTSTFTQLFDQYTIEKVKVVLRPLCNAVLTTVSAAPPIIQTCLMDCIDYDDNTAPTSLNYVQQYENARFHSVFPNPTERPITRTFKPRVAVTMPNAVGSNVIARNEASGWIDCSQVTIPHFGYKFYIEQGAGVDFLQQWRFEATYWIAFRNVR